MGQLVGEINQIFLRYETLKSGQKEKADRIMETGGLIDKILIDSLMSADVDMPVLDTIVDLSRRLNLTTIAEGVMAAHQVEWLIKNHVAYVQGYRGIIMAGPRLPVNFICGTKGRYGNDTSC